MLSHGNAAQLLPNPPARTTPTSTFSGNLDGPGTQELAFDNWRPLTREKGNTVGVLWTESEASADHSRSSASCPSREPRGGAGSNRQHWRKRVDSPKSETAEGREHLDSERHQKGSDTGAEQDFTEKRGGMESCRHEGEKVERRGEQT